MTTNPFEKANREKRVRTLVAHFDHFLTGCGLDPQSDALAMVMSLERMKPEVWAHHAECCDLRKPPSETTRREVIAVYQGRVVAHEAAQDEPDESRVAS